MTDTVHLALTLVDAAQAQKEVTVNQALTRLDAILNTAAKDRTLATPPGSPINGDVYIVAASPTGAWAGQAKAVAYYDQIWRFITPLEGMRLFVANENSAYVFDGTNWVSEESQLASVTTIAASGASVAVDCSKGSSYDITLTAAPVTITITNPPAGGKCVRLVLFLRQDATGSRTISWPVAVKWAGGSAPTLTTTASRLDVVELFSVNGGTSWQGRVVGLNYN